MQFQLGHILEFHKPSIVLLQKTWLNNSIEHFNIANYSCISRQDNRHGGGIAIYAKIGFKNLVHLEDSLDAERSWHYLHTDLGIIALCNFYRPPDAGIRYRDNYKFTCRNTST